jgi:hypothetical protein
MDYDMATHCSNYWLCDAIIQQGKGVTGTEYDHGSWQAAEVLQLAMPFDVDNYNHEHPYLLALLHHLAMCEFSRTSAPYWHLQIPSIAIPNAVMFQKFDKLSVLKLSGRIFSLSSPPFLYCHSLKFLWLDHCQDQEINTEGSGTIKEEDIQRCFQRLWVLDVRYTRCDRILSARMLDFMSQLRELNVTGALDWDIGQLQWRLPNIRKLRVAKSTVSRSSCSEKNLVSGMNKLELLDLSGNRAAMPVVYISEMSTISHCLETVIITDGCVGVQEFSFKGCAKLKHLLLSGLFEDLGILDLSRTAVKTLDLSAVTAPNLAQLFLDGCQKLCAILWPPEDKRRSYLQKIHMDTTESAAASESLSEAHGGPVPSELYWCIWVRDARLLRSLVPFESYFYSRSVHMEISSPAIGLLGPAGKNDDEAINSIKRGMPSFLDDARDCYIHVQDCGLQESSSEETSTVITIPEMICRSARILHVHDSLSITSIPGPAPMLSSTWRLLYWCRVERCPKLECVFTTPQLQESSDNFIFYYLKTLWASQLPKARYIWNWSTAVAFDLGDRSFEELSSLHLDLCPRIIHVLPLRMPMVERSLRNLVTLEIVWCGNLEVVFPLYTSSADESRQHQEEQSRITVEFQNLKHIHLHELPKLRGICGHWKISAPMLETVKVRGCWSLKRLPAVSSSKSKKVECDCEKEWWGNLEWGMTANHDPSLYKTIHSPYYKKATLRSSALI